MGNNSGKCQWEGCTKPSDIDIVYSEPYNTLSYCDEHAEKAQESTDESLRDHVYEC